MSGKHDIPLQERIIFALDVADGDTAHEWITRLESHIGFFKIGLELFISGGIGLVREIASRNHKLMLDLKLYDVPATISRALTRLNGCGARFVTVHGDRAIITAATQAETDFDLLAVTVLTSLDREGVRELGATSSIKELVMQRARLAVDANCAGVVASALEARALRNQLGDELTIVSPGIRAQTAAKDDQKRTADAARAIVAGADHLVIGRPIRDAVDPLTAVAKFQQQIQATLAER